MKGETLGENKKKNILQILAGYWEAGLDLYFVYLEEQICVAPMPSTGQKW